MSTERGILFSSPMVRGVLDGSKTQTRRVVKPQPFDRSYSKHDHRMAYASGRATDGDEIDGFYAYSTSSGGEWRARSPYGQPGDRLWVRETFSHLGEGSFGIQEIEYRADGECDPNVVPRWTPSIHMPRWASRILLEITSVRVERLQAIGEADARAEGVTIKDRHTVGYCAGEFLPPSIRAYRDLWDSINGAGSWDTNPWVWVVEFKRIDNNGGPHADQT
jgi:hypothetical protein